MGTKRRDSRRRVLRDGEYQRADGMYRYRYRDSYNKRCDVYSWRLEEHDPYPEGKPHTISLREMEKKIIADKNNGIVYGGNTTVLELVKRYVKTRTGVRYSTKRGYETVIHLLEQDPFGSRRIDSIRLSDVKTWFIDLHDGGRMYSTIMSIRGVLRPAFQMAFDDDLIRKNPFNFKVSTIIANDAVTREALTPDQYMRFMSFVQNDKHYKQYYDGFYILFWTGLRVAELCGLTISDIDFDRMRINVERQLIRVNADNIFTQPPKTEKGIRFIPMTEEVAECFRRVIKNRKKPKVEPMIDGHVGFIFLEKNGSPTYAYHWENHFEWAVIKYNQTHKVQLPHITPHMCRHTFCSVMAKKGMNPKMLQYIMGHSEISITLDTYTHCDFEDAQEEMNRIAAVM